MLFDEPHEPPEPCFDCGTVFGPRARRILVDHTDTGRELRVCLACNRKRERAQAKAEKAKPDLVDWMRVRRGAKR